MIFAIKKEVQKQPQKISQNIFNKVPKRWWNFSPVFGINGIISLPQFITTTRTIYINSSISASLCRRYTNAFFGAITGFHIFINICHDSPPFYKLPAKKLYHKYEIVQKKLLNLFFFIECLHFFTILRHKFIIYAPIAQLEER